MRIEQTKRPRGRPRAYDEAQALDRALEVFWRQGYEGASLADLTKAMGLTSPSIYAAYGSKENLYRQVLARYGATWGAGTTRALTEEKTAYDAIARVLREAAHDFSHLSPPRGCMISTAVLSCAPENRGAAQIASELRNATLVSLEALFQRSIETGEIPRDQDPRALARFYGAIIQGMSVQAVDGASFEELTAIGENALRAWPR